MADAPYFITDSVALAANGTGAFNFFVPVNESYDVMDLRFTSTGAFNVTDIRDSAGKHYTNASTTDPLNSTHLQNGASANIGFQSFPVPLHLNGGMTLTLDFLDTSGAANTVRVAFLAVRHTE